MSSKAATSSNTHAHNQQKKEFQVRIPKTANKRLTILKFNESLNVKPQRWTTETLRMEREDNRRAGITTSGGFVQDFGEGSEYGKAAREEARLKKFGRQTRKYEHDKQPWRLTIEQQVTGNTETGTSKTTKLRKFRSMREAGASEHADYWIFYKSGNDLEAYKVDEWYQFLPAVTYKYLDAEQAEERFKERDKVLNQFALKAQIQKQLAEQEDQLHQQQRQKIGEALKRTGALKIKDEASSDEDEEGDDDESEQNDKPKNGKKKKEGKKGKKPKTEKEEKKTKKQRVKAADEIADYESEDGQDEGREYDYMSDSGSDSEREELNVDQKMDDELVGVADEQGLKHDLGSDEDDDDFDDNEDDESEDEEAKKDKGEIKKNGVKEQSNEIVESRAKAVKNVDKMMEQNSGARIRADIDAADESDDSDFDEDPDSAKINSVLFMQDKRKVVPSLQQRKRQEPGGSTETMQSFSEQPEAKRFEAISESFIRKLLERRPHSTKQLLTKVNQRFQQQHKQDDNQTPPVKDKKIVAQLAEILKKIEPYQFRKKNEAGKDVLYFSMNRTA